MSSAVLPLITLTLVTVVTSNLAAAAAASTTAGGGDDGVDNCNSTTGDASSSTWIPSSDEAATATSEGNLTDVSSTASTAVDSATWTGNIKSLPPRSATN